MERDLGSASDHSPMLPQISNIVHDPTAPEIVNIVASIKLGCSLNLQQLASTAQNVEYDPSEFKGLKMRIRQPKTTAIIYGSGKVVVTEAKTEASSRLACRKVARILRHLGYSAKVSEWRIENCVAVAQMPFIISLERLNVFGAEGMSTSYEPELWPGLIMTEKTSHEMTFSVFCSGKVFITGFQQKLELEKGFQRLVPILTQFRAHQGTCYVPAKRRSYFNQGARI